MQTDKASMLDEIIDYVKFLQLQVKVKIASYHSTSSVPFVSFASLKDCVLSSIMTCFAN
jgi:hypothetical protein